MGPDLLCLDEPTNGLDEASYLGLVSFLRSFVAADKTVLVATHDDAFVEALDARRIPLGP
jgi:ABC-type multidrug transport system ATPase subunit